MMSAKLLTFLTFFGIVAKLFADDAVKVSVYYETLCSDSRAFITNQLYSTYKSIGSDIIALELIPYGNVFEINTTGTVVYSCQHGPQECYGNKVHGCALTLFPLDDTLNFINCSEAAWTPVANDTLHQCAIQAGISWARIEQCFSSGEAEKIFAANGEKTNSISPSFIPTIAFDGKFNQTYQDEALTDFKKIICRLIYNRSPACSRNDPFIVY
ncbi:gamma-interferon-inducible lysosomal thiol reductase-like [Cylas formicarius]|uniref:gamma-interferon-inducible lysosomal thiol reductase-like n=1 Tax=Cylas formicarius TaxID=197179 RepID=UPI002958657E|nr:gamma-interferon-inducible lysosomal thiol reductase-like [Cylas formicarius]